MDLDKLAAKVQAAGVVGAGGAGFPTHVKLNNPCEAVLINGAECEPLLQVDQQLLETEAVVLVDTLGLLVKATGAKCGIFAIKAKYRRAVAAVATALAGHSELELFQLGDFYPAGDEQVLVYEVLGQVVPPGGIPLQVGAVVLNVETLLNIARACRNKPVTHKYVTVAGAVAHPVTVRVPVGTPVAAVLNMAGGPTISDYRVLEGGPMMGKPVDDLTRGITKTTKGLLVLPAGHRLWRLKDLPTGIILKRAMAVCCQCSACTDLCPRHLLGHPLEPHRILRNVAHNVSHDPAGVIAAQLCSECGACDHYACPMDISPRLINAAVKRELAEQGFKWHPAKTGRPHSLREGRKIPVHRLISRLGLSMYHGPAPLQFELAHDLAGASSSNAENIHRSETRETTSIRTSGIGSVRPEQVSPETTNGDTVHRTVSFRTSFFGVRLELKQHVGVPCYPVVQPGDKVTLGQPVAAVPDGQLGSPIHASITGTVIAVSPQIVIAG